MKSKYHTAQFTPPYGIQHRQRVERAAHLAYHTNADGPVVRCVGFKCVVGSSLAAARSPPYSQSLGHCYALHTHPPPFHAPLPPRQVDSLACHNSCTLPMRRKRPVSPTSSIIMAPHQLQRPPPPAATAAAAQRPSSLLLLLLSLLLPFTTLAQHKPFTLAAAAGVILPPPDTTPVPAEGTITEPGFEPLRKFLPPTLGNAEGENEEATAGGAAAAGSAQKGRDAWPSYRNVPAIAFQTTQGGSWQFRPRNGTESVLFVLVERSLKYLPTFGWEETMTGLSPWSSRPDLHFVFVPMTDSMDAHRVAQEAQTVLSSNPDNAEYWLPRMHFSLDTIDSLRKSSSWFAAYVDAWSIPAPSVAVLYSDHKTGSEQRFLDLYDATPPISGLAVPAPGAVGACEDDVVGGTCGKLAFFGTACLGKDGDNLPLPPQPVQDVEGKVALVARGGCTFAEKVKVLKASGAVAAIIYSDETPRSPWLATEGGKEGGVVKPETFPLVLIDREPGQVLRGMTMDSTLVDNLTVTLFERASPPWAFAADRFGRFRRLLRGYDSLAAAVLEATNFEFEALVAQTNPPAADLGLNPTSLTVSVLEGGGGREGGRPAAGGPLGNSKSATEAVVEIPSYITERPNSGLHLKIDLMCPDRDEEKCPSLSSFVKVYACEVPQKDEEGRHHHHYLHHRYLEEGMEGVTSEEEGRHHYHHHYLRHLVGVESVAAAGPPAPPAAGGIPQPDILKQRAQSGAPPPIDTSGGNGNTTPSLPTTLPTPPLPPTSAAAAGAAAAPRSTPRPSIIAQQPRDAVPHNVGAEGNAGNNWDPRVWEGCGGEVVELGRLVTPAGREMLTLVEASPFLAALPLKGDYRRGGGSGEYRPYRPKIKVFVVGTEGYDVSLSLLFTAANPGDLVPYQIFRVSSLEGGREGGAGEATPQKAELDSSPPQSIPLPRGVPSYALVATITAEGLPAGSDRPSASHMFRIQEDAPMSYTDSPPPPPPPPLEWTVPLMFQSQPFGCSNLTLTRAGVVPNQVGDWYSSQPGFCPGQPVALKQFSMSRAPSADEGKITVEYVIDDFGNGELGGGGGGKKQEGGKGGGRGNPPVGSPGHVDLEAYLVTYAFLPETPEISTVAFVNATVLPPSLAPSSPFTSSTSVGSSVTTLDGHTTLTLRLPGPPVKDGQDALVSFPPPFLDPSIARMPVDLYRITLSERVTGDTLVYTFPVSAPPDLSITTSGEPPTPLAPVNSQAAQVGVRNSTAAIPSQGRGNEGGMGGGMGVGNDPFPAIPPLTPTNGNGGNRRVQAPVEPPPSLPPSSPPSMQLVLQNLQPRTDYLVKISAVSSAGPSRASVLTVNVPGAASSLPPSPPPSSSSSSRRRRHRHHKMGAAQDEEWGEEGGEEGEDPSLGVGGKVGLAVGLLGALGLLSMFGVWVWRSTAPSRFFSLGEGEGGREGGVGVVSGGGGGTGGGLGGGVRRRRSRRREGEEEGEEEEEEEIDVMHGRGGKGGGEGEGEEGRPFPPRTRSAGSLRRSASLGALSDYESGVWEAEVAREEGGLQEEEEEEEKREARPIFDLV